MKSIPIILGLYLLYYMGMIIYDLFLKKEKVVETENNEQHYSISDFAEQNKEKPVVVGIEDVENIRTPKSYEEMEEPFVCVDEEMQDIEKLKSKYEEEEDFEEQGETVVETEKEKNTSIVNKPITSKSIKEMMMLINTKVKMVANYEGQKVYHIES